jgi:enamine deaminase RidA (YjgF/YER057c/UK114 family)
VPIPSGDAHRCSTGALRTSENSVPAKFAEFLKAELQLLRIYLLRMSRNSDGQRAAWLILAGTPIPNERIVKVSDFPNSSAAGSTGSVRYINPDSLNNNPAFTNVVVVEGNVKTVHIGGQDALNASGEIVGKGDIVAQTEQILANVRAALAAGGARPEHIIKWNLYVVEGQSLQEGFAAFQNAWPQTPNPPAITMAFVSGLAHPDFLVEMDAVAVVPQ